MLDRDGAAGPVPEPAGGSPGARRMRRRALVGCALLALALHGAFIASVGGFVAGAIETSSAPMSVRTVRGAPAEEPRQELVAASAETAVPGPELPKAPVDATVRTRPRAAAAGASRATAIDAREASANSSANAPFRPVAPTDPATSTSDGATIATAEASAGPVAEVGDATAPARARARPGDGQPLLALGDEPPPVYRTQLPPPVTLHYQLRRGSLGGTAQIRWQPGSDSYRLVLEAQVAGIAMLKQTSEGGIDATGLAPVRFLDQRARRSAVAANFRREDGRVTFSGARAEWPLFPGSQDRLSWMIQLAGVAAAAPDRLVAGGTIAMVVVGARGDASVWTFRYAGRDTIETASGTVHGVKLVREARSAYDTSADIWLDPDRSYLPAHATLRNSTGAFEYDLRLERVESE